MACASQASIMLSAANSYCRVASSSSSSLPCSNLFLDTRKRPTSLNLFRIRASAEESDCNAEECAPEKEVGKVSVEWLAAERTKVVGTFPPRRTRGWTGYVEKDTAGQTNIYSVEPAVYVAESAISSGTSGSSADGAEKTLAIYGGLALAFVAAASSILLQVGKNPPQMQMLEYSGPSLSYYISKFTPPETIEATVPAENETSVSVQTEGNNAPEVSEVQAAEYGNLPDASTLSSNVS